jgi:hypothetical protein
MEDASRRDPEDRWIHAALAIVHHYGRALLKIVRLDPRPIDRVDGSGRLDS